MEQVNRSLVIEFDVSVYELAHGLDFKTAKFDDRDFVLVSYRKNEQGEPKMQSLAHIRGWIFDAEGRLLVKGFAFAETLYQIPTETNLLSQSYHFLPQGPMVRVMLMNDQLWFTTHTSLDAGRARYGDSDNFKSLLLSLADMTEAELRARLFPEGVKTSNVVHVFTVCDLKVMPCFQMKTDGFVYYIGAYRQELPGWDHYEHDSTVVSPHCYVLTNVEQMPELKGLVDHITYTESLALRLFDEGVGLLMLGRDSVDTLHAYRLLSPRMSAAEEIMGNEPNLLLRACTIMKDVFPDEFFTYFDLPIVHSCENYWMLMTRAIGPNRATEMSMIIEKLQEARDKAIDKVVTAMGNFKIFPNLMSVWRSAYTFQDATGVVKENDQKKRALQALVNTLNFHYRASITQKHAVADFKRRMLSLSGLDLHRLITKLP